MVTLNIEQTTNNSAVILKLEGYVDADTAPSLYQELERLRFEGQKHIIIDCHEVTYLSSHGIWTIVKHVIEIRKDGGDIRLASPTEWIRMMMQDLNMHSFIQNYPTIEETIESFKE